MNAKEVRQIGNVMPTATRENPNQGRVYRIDGLAPTITDVSGGGRQTADDHCQRRRETEDPEADAA